MNSTETEIKLRKYKDNVKISAYGAVILGLWNILKYVLYLVMDTGFFDEIFDALNYSHDDERAIIVLSFILLAIDFFIKLSISRSALKEINGTRNKKGNGYIVFGIILAVLYIIMDISNIFILLKITDISLLVDQIVTMLVDVTSIYALCDLLYCTIRYKMLIGKLNTVSVEDKSYTNETETAVTDMAITDMGGMDDAG